MFMHKFMQQIVEMKQTQQEMTIDHQFISDVNAANLQGASLPSHMLLWITFGFVVIALTWAHFATLDEVTRGSGKIIPSSHIQVIQNLEGGILSAILIKEGDLVEKGQALLQLDEVRFAFIKL